MLCFSHDVISAGWYQVHTYIVHNTYPTLKPRLVAYPRLKPRLVEHTTHGHTRRLFFWDASIWNSHRSNKTYVTSNNVMIPTTRDIGAVRIQSCIQLFLLYFENRQTLVLLALRLDDVLMLLVGHSVCPLPIMYSLLIRTPIHRLARSIPMIT